jgi:hypothetical protein
MSILEGDLADDITAALSDGGVPYAVTVTRSSPGEPDLETPWQPGTPVVTPHQCMGWVDAYLSDEIDGTSILSSDLKIVVLLSTLAIMPAVGDSVTARGATYLVVNVQTDPALATATLQVRA